MPCLAAKISDLFPKGRLLGLIGPRSSTDLGGEMLKVFQNIQEFWRNPRIDEIWRLQILINDFVPENRLGLIFREKWGCTYVLLSFHSEMGFERTMEYDLDTAYWYVLGIAEGILNVARSKNLR
jgi:hypothetical protein